MSEPIIQERAPFIDGGSRQGAGTLEVRSPYDGRVVTKVRKAGPADLEEAIASSARGFEAMRRKAPWERAAILHAVSSELGRRKEEMARVLALEAGKPMKAALVEASRAVHTFEVAAEEAKRLGGEVLPIDSVPWGAGHLGILRRFPLGPVAGITPFNFPLNLTAHKIAPALASGDSIVIKPASQTPSSAILLAEMATAAGAPPGAVNVVPMAGSESDPLVTDERLKLVTFTGSPAVGWDLKRRAGRKRVTLELGGNAGAIVCSGADLDLAVDRIIAGGYGYAGQSCISVQRVLVERPVMHDFLHRLVTHVRFLKVGDPLDPATDVGPMISAAEAERAEGWIREAVEGGARILIGGEREGAILRPAVITETRAEMKVECLELFAPAVTVGPFDDFHDALARINDSRFGLQAGVFTRDAGRAWEAYETLEVGGVMINDVPTFRVDQMPYGGVKESGFGREGLRWAIEEMTEPKLLVWNLTTTSSR